MDVAAAAWRGAAGEKFRDKDKEERPSDVGQRSAAVELAGSPR